MTRCTIGRGERERPIWLTAIGTITLCVVLIGGLDQSHSSHADASEIAAEDGARDTRITGELRDLGGAVHRPFEDAETKAVVLVFVLSDCPIANSYAAELNRIDAAYKAQGVRLFLVHVDPELTLERAQEHAQEYELRAPVVLDGRHEWVKKVGATVTPEAAVLSRAGELLYIGRIDDRYVDFGKRRTQVTSHDLREALDAVLAGEKVAKRRTKAIGCYITDITAGE